MKIFILILFFALTTHAFPAQAQELLLPKPVNKMPKVEKKPAATPSQLSKVKEQAQFYYTRAEITLIRRSLPQNVVNSQPAQDMIMVEGEPPLPLPPLDPAIIFDVEIRDGLSMYNHNGWFDMSSYEGNTGLMMAFTDPVKKPIVRSTQYAPVDILFLDKQGKITQIAPSISLSDLESEIYPESPILAYLFLRGGLCAEQYINVGDEVQYHIFKKPPVILNAPREIPPVRDGNPPPHQKAPLTPLEQPVDKGPPITNYINSKQPIQAKEPLKQTAPVSNILQNNVEQLEMRKK